VLISSVQRKIYCHLENRLMVRTIAMGGSNCKNYLFRLKSIPIPRVGELEKLMLHSLLSEQVSQVFNVHFFHFRETFHSHIEH